MKCGQDFSGRADKILAEVYGLPRQELASILYDGVSAGSDISDKLDFADHWDEYETDEIISDIIEIPPAIDWGPDALELDHKAARAGREYLAKRGISVTLASEYGIRYDPSIRRVLFPVVVEGQVRGWQARSIDPTEVLVGERIVRIPKIITTGQVGGKAVMHQDRLVGARKAIIVEGPVDAIKCDLLWRRDGVAVTATMGKSITSDQIDIYRRSSVKDLYLGLDDDAADKISQLASQLADRFTIYRLEAPAGREDLGDAELEEVWLQYQATSPLRVGSPILSRFADPFDYERQII
jgi:hypothetical protein